MLILMEKYWNVKEVANKFRKSEKTIRAMIRRGDIEAVKFGRDYLVIPFDHYHFAEIKFHRSITENLKLMRSARQSIWILGMNALGPLHQGREILINQVNAGKCVRILLLDPVSSAFAQRILFEEGVKKDNDDIMLFSGRLTAEHDASMAILRDIVNFTIDDRDLELRFHCQDPTESLIIVDAASLDHAICHYNPYPKKTTTRGLCGPNFSISKENAQDTIEFKKCFDRYIHLWDSAKPIDVMRAI